MVIVEMQEKWANNECILHKEMELTSFAQGISRRTGSDDEKKNTELFLEILLEK